MKVGVLGAGHLGKIHLKILQELPEFEVVGFYDPDTKKTIEAKEKFGLEPFADVEDLIQNVDVVDIVTTTLSHYECAQMAFRNSKHIFIEKPITNTLEEAKRLINLAHEANVTVQVGHVERFNPAFKAAYNHFNRPMFVECHRLSQFNQRGTDVSVVLDLMIHDIDIILSVVKANIKKIHASGVAVISDSPDIANARIEFDNGCVANLTASRISMKSMRKSRFFQKDAYISVDFLEKKTEVIKIKDVHGVPDPLSMTIDPGKGKTLKEIQFENPSIESNNAIKEELSSFANAIVNGSSPMVTIDDGYKALEVANEIVEKLKLSPNLFQE